MPGESITKPTTVQQFLKTRSGLRVEAVASDRFLATIDELAGAVTDKAAELARAEKRTTLLERDRPKIEQRFSCEEIEDALMFGEPVLYRPWEEGEEWRYRVIAAHPLGDLLGIVFVLRNGAVRPFSAFYATSKDEERVWKRRKPRPPLD